MFPTLLLPPAPVACPPPASRKGTRCWSSRLAAAPVESLRLLRDRDEGLQPSNEPAQAPIPAPEANNSKPKRVSRRGAGSRAAAASQQPPNEDGPANQQNGEEPQLQQPLQPVNTPEQDAEALAEQQRDNKLLEASLRSATSRKEAIQCVLLRQGKPLQPPQLVFVCNHLAKMCEPESMSHKDWVEMQVFMQRLLDTYPGHVDHMSAYELVVMLTALARAHYTPTSVWLERYLQASMPHLPAFGPGYIYLLLRALGRLNLQLWELKRAPSFRDWMHKLLAVAQSKVWAYRGDELVRTLSALTALRWHPSPEWSEAFSTAIKHRLEFLDPPLLSQALMALSAQRQQPEPGLVHAMFTQLATKLPMFDDQDLASAAQAVGLVKRIMHGEFFSDFMVEVGQKASTFSPVLLAHLLHALSVPVSTGNMAVLSPMQLAAATAAARAHQQQWEQASPALSSLDGALDAVTGGRRNLGRGDSGESDEDEEHVLGYGLNGNGNGAGVVASETSASAQQPAMAAIATAPGQLSPAPSRQQRRPLFTGAEEGSPAPESLDSNGLSSPQAPPPRRQSVSAAQLPVNALELRPLYPDAATAAAAAAAAAARSAGRAGGDRGGSAGAQRGGGGADHGVRNGRRVLPAASPAWLRVVAARIYECLPRMSVYHASMSLRGLVMLGHQLESQPLSEFFQASLPHLRMGHSNSLVYLAQALSTSGYKPHTPEAAVHFETWHEEFCRLASRRAYSPKLVCDMIVGLAGLPIAPPPQLISTVLTHTRRDRPGALRHTSPRQLARLGTALRALRFRPDFGFIHSYAQAVRFHWSGFKAQELTAVMCGLASFQPDSLAVDELWMSEQLLMIQCRLDRFDGGLLTALLAAVVQLVQDPGRPPPSDKWCEALVARLEEQSRSMTAPHAASILWSFASITCLKAQQEQTKQRLTMQMNLMHASESSDQPTPLAAEERVAATVLIPPPFMQRLVGCVADGVTLLSDSQVQDVTWAVQVLGQEVPPQLAVAEQQAGVRRQAAAQVAAEQAAQQATIAAAMATAAAAAARAQREQQQEQQPEQQQQQPVQYGQQHQPRPDGRQHPRQSWQQQPQRHYQEAAGTHNGRLLVARGHPSNGKPTAGVNGSTAAHSSGKRVHQAVQSKARATQGVALGPGAGRPQNGHVHVVASGQGAAATLQRNHTAAAADSAALDGIALASQRLGLGSAGGVGDDAAWAVPMPAAGAQGARGGQAHLSSASAQQSVSVPA